VAQVPAVRLVNAKGANLLSNERRRWCGKTLHPIQDGLNLQLNSWSPGRWVRFLFKLQTNRARRSSAILFAGVKSEHWPAAVGAVGQASAARTCREDGPFLSKPSSGELGASGDRWNSPPKQIRRVAGAPAQQFADNERCALALPCL